jgi:hypothetical protein
MRSIVAHLEKKGENRDRSLDPQRMIDEGPMKIAP